MKRILTRSWASICERIGVVPKTESDRCIKRLEILLDIQTIHSQDMSRCCHEERAHGDRLQGTIESLEPALAECLDALREIAATKVGCSPRENALHRKRQAQKVLDRIQIPVADLPITGYPKEAEQNGVDHA